MPLIDRYREIEGVACEMLEAGRAGDWTRVGDLGSTIRSLADDVARAGGPEALDAGERRERMRILTRLVVVDGELRRLADPASARLDSMFDPPARGGDASRPA
ncbi:MAG TPA: flagellar protein FliT [Zeimonas sp.]